VADVSRFTDALNAQIANEFAASQQYVAVAVWYDGETLPQLAAHFYRQALEERNHAMMLVQYLLDRDQEPTIPGVEAPRVSFGNAVEPVELALAQEKRVTDQIAALVRIAREEDDLLAEQFLQWFLKEQVEEVASMTSLLRTLQRAGDNLLLVEEQLARTSAAGEASDVTAPAAAGGAV
jgi:bacterioferritin B